MKACVSGSNDTPAGSTSGKPVTDSVVPSSTSDALANAFKVTPHPSSRAVPATAPVTTGASFTPAICIVAVAQLSVPLPRRIA